MKMRIEKIGRQTLVNADCLEYIDTLPDKSIDAVITSPPYNIGLAYNSYDDSKSRAQYRKWLKQLAKKLQRVLKDDASIFLNVGDTPKNQHVTHDMRRAFTSFHMQNQIAWVKSVHVGDKTHGNFKPINSERFLNNTFELIYHYTKTGNVKVDRLSVGVPFTHKSNIKRFGHKRDKRCRGNVWYLAYKNRNAKKVHPASFPLSLPMRCLRLTGLKKGKVLDPFNGSGTTLVAAQRLGWSGVGIEIDKRYHALAAKRLRKAI